MSGAITIVRSDGESLTFDAVSEYVVGGSATATRHPTEDSAKISDHIQENPATISFRGVVTETPSRRVDSAGGPDRTLRAWIFLRACTRTLVSVVSARNGTLTNMTLTRWPVSVGAVKNFTFEIQLDEIQVATAEVVALPGLSGASTTDAGEQGTTDAATIEAVTESLAIAAALTTVGSTGSTTTPGTDRDTSALLEMSDWLGLGI